MTKKQQKLLERLAALMEAQTPREWINLLDQADIEVNVSQLKRFQRAVKKHLDERRRVIAKTPTAIRKRIAAKEDANYIAELKPRTQVQRSEFGEWLRIIGNHYPAVAIQRVEAGADLTQKLPESKPTTRRSRS